MITNKGIRTDLIHKNMNGLTKKHLCSKLVNVAEKEGLFALLRIAHDPRREWLQSENTRRFALPDYYFS